MAIVGWEWILVLVLIIVIIWVAARLLRRPTTPPATTQPSPTIIKEREVIKEIVMVPCRYCGGLMPQASVFCPNCGGRRQ